MAFNPRKIDKYIPRKSPVKAVDLNDIVARLERLERLTTAEPIQLDTSPSSLVIGFNHDFFRTLDFYRFVQFTEQSIDPVDELFYCKQIKRENNRSLTVFGRPFQFGNLFRYCARINEYGLVIKFPCGNAEWTLIQTVCPEDVCESGM